MGKRIPLAGAQQRFADTHGMLPDAGMGVAHAGNGMFRSQLAKAIKRAEGVEPCLGVGARLEQLSQGLGRLRVAAMKEQLLGGVACPAAGAVERGDELGGGFAGEIGDRPWIGAVTINPVNPAAIRARTEVDPLFHVVGNPLRVLEHEAVKVGDP